MIRKIIFWFHLVCGLTAGCVILSMAVTGVLLGFESQIVEFAERNQRYVEVPAAREVLNSEKLIELASVSYPEEHASAITVFYNPARSVLVQFGRGKSVYINPYTGAVLGGSSKTHDFMHWVERWHRWLGNKEFGQPITGFCNAVFLLLGISGIYLWWPRNGSRAAFSRIVWFQKDLKGKARDWNWHNVIGLWTWPFLIITTTTGLIMSYSWANDLLFQIADGEKPAARAPRQSEGKGRPTVAPHNLDSLIDLARVQIPVWESVNVRFQTEMDKPVQISITEKSRPVRKRSVMTVNPSSGDIKKWEPYSEQSLGRRLRGWVKPLHTGEAAGLAGQTMSSLAAFGWIVLVYTGFALAWRRFSGKKFKKNGDKKS